MRLKVLLPTRVLVDEEVSKVVAEAENGGFCLLPRHVDFVAALVPGILYFMPMEGSEQVVAVDTGILMKCGPNVLVSTINAARGSDLRQLKDLVANAFLELDEHERHARTALARLEAGTIRRFMELQEKS
jgi:F-type H+-transporting ATPase subunit epsilon